MHVFNIDCRSSVSLLRWGGHVRAFSCTSLSFFASFTMTTLLLSLVSICLSMVTAAYRPCRNHSWRCTGLQISFLEYFRDTSLHLREVMRPCHNGCTHGLQFAGWCQIQSVVGRNLKCIVIEEELVPHLLRRTWTGWLVGRIQISAHSSIFTAFVREDCEGPALFQPLDQMLFGAMTIEMIWKMWNGTTFRPISKPGIHLFILCLATRMGRQHSAGTCAHTVYRRGLRRNSPESASRWLSSTDKCLFEPTHQEMVSTVVCITPMVFVFTDPSSLHSNKKKDKHGGLSKRTKQEKNVWSISRSVLDGHALNGKYMAFQDSHSVCQHAHCFFLHLNIW